MLTKFFSTVRDWLALHRRETREVRGFRVLVDNSRPDIETSAVLERLDDALALIERYAPRALRRLHHDLHEIWIARYPCRGAYFPAHRSCLTELTFLARRDISPAVVASSIVHEGTHARVDQFRRRVGGQRAADDVAREERLCRKAELQFGRALPADLGAPVIDRALATLSLDDAEVAPAIDWEVARERIERSDRRA